MRPQPGAIVDFYSEGELIAGVILAEEKGRLRVVTESGREDRLAPGRVLAVYEGNPKLAMPPASKTDPSRTDAAKALARAHARSARERRAGIDLEVVWDLLVDDGSARGLDELAELASGERSDAARAAVLRGLLEEKVHFTRRAELWEPRPRSAVEEILRQREQEKRRAEERARFVRSARAALAGGAPFARAGEAEEGRLLAALEEVAVQANNASAAAFRDAEWACTELGVRGPTPEYAAFAALRGLGLFSEDENLFIRRYGLQVAFPEGADELCRRAIEEALGRAQAGGSGRGGPGSAGSAGELGYRPLAAGPAAPEALSPGLAAELDRGARRDLTHLDLFSVDDELTSEIDDALSIEPAGEGRWRVGIHIADPGFFVRPGSELDALAASRAVTFYLPDRRVLMLPSVLAEEASSLLPATHRPAISFFATIDDAGLLLDTEIAPSVIRSRTRVTYEQAAEAVRGDGPDPEGLAAALGATTIGQLRSLHRLATRLEAWRISMGAHIIRAPEVDLTVSPDGTITLKRLEGDDPGRVLVSEMMILASRMAAAFCLENRIPCIYRRQPPAEEALAGVKGGPYDPVAVRKARRGLRRSESGLTPGRHFALGLDAYAQATSPIRRFQDLVIHRQIVSVLRGGSPCYPAETLAGIAALTDEAERIARLAERGSDEYWTLRYLASRRAEPVEGVVVYVERRRVEVELSETLYTVSIAPRPDHEPGQRLRFLIEDVNPRVPSITLRQLEPV